MRHLLAENRGGGEGIRMGRNEEEEEDEDPICDEEEVETRYGNEERTRHTRAAHATSAEQR